MTNLSLSAFRHCGLDVFHNFLNPVIHGSEANRSVRSTEVLKSPENKFSTRRNNQQREITCATNSPTPRMKLLEENRTYLPRRTGTRCDGSFAAGPCRHGGAVSRGLE